MVRFPTIHYYCHYPSPNQMNRLLHDNIDNTRHHKDCIIQIQSLATVVMRTIQQQRLWPLWGWFMQDTFRGWLNSRRWLIWITTQIPPSKLNQLKPTMSFQVTKPTQMGSRLKYPTVEEARAQQLTPRWWVECVHLSMLKSMSNYASLCNFRATWRTKPSHGTILTCTLAIKPEGRNSRIYSARYL